MTDLQTLYDFYVIARSRLLGLHSITMSMTEFGIAMLFTWKMTESGMTPSISYTITQIELDYMKMDMMETIIDRVESAYKVWEVGEE